MTDRSDETASNGLTHRELCADLESLNVSFDPRNTPDQLLAQRNAARATR